MQRKTYETLLQQLIRTAAELNIDVRTEKLLREVGYHARSGRCRLKNRELIILDRDAAIADQVEFLAAELSKQEIDLERLPPPVRSRIKK